MKKILISIGSVVSFGLPMLVLAAGPNLNGYLGTLIKSGTSLLQNVLVFLIALAVVWFIWNVIRYTLSEDEEKKGKAKSQMIWGIVAIAVIVSVWGIVGLLQGAFGLNQGTTGFQGNTGSMIPQ
jgi:uncharacterized membrane protein YidH (DUF202 family)